MRAWMKVLAARRRSDRLKRKGRKEGERSLASLAVQKIEQASFLLLLSPLAAGWNHPSLAAAFA